MENSDSTTPTHSARRFLGDALGAWAPSPTTQQWNDSRRPDGGGAAAGAAAAAGTLHTGPLPHSISKLHIVDSSSPGVGSPFAIRSYPENHQPAAADGRDMGSGAAVQEALAADYRAQLKQYAVQLASKENEVAQLRATTATLKAQLGSATGGLADAGEQAARSSAQVLPNGQTALLAGTQRQLCISAQMGFVACLAVARCSGGRLCECVDVV